ncbi:hypothetical protein ABTW56_04260 [Enterobacter roggenkampii]|uniref:hypothetical protein n=1 Tax=Enterobacter roggenkampii TaxID=1812935 RepID=UPI003314831F
MNIEHSFSACGDNQKLLLLLIRQSELSYTPCCASCQSALNAWHNNNVAGGVACIDDLPDATSYELLMKNLRNLRYAMTAAPRQAGGIVILVCQQLSRITQNSAIHLQPAMLSEVQRNWIMHALKPRLKRQQQSAELLQRLLNPAPLIARIRYWRTADSNQVLACEPEPRDAAFSFLRLNESGLEMLASFRLLQEMVQEKIHAIAPLSLTVSLAWLSHPCLPELLFRTLSFSQQPVRLVLNIDSGNSDTLTEQLLTNIRELKQQGLRFVLSTQGRCGHYLRLKMLCDGVRYDLATLLASGDAQAELKMHQREGKFIQIGGITSPEQSQLAGELGGEQLLSF